MAPQPQNESPHASALRTSAHTFCTALLSPPPPPDLLSQHFTPHPTIHEHGPPWATSRLPFLGRPFTGRAECESYFSLLSSTLRMHLDESSFPGPEGFVVDAGRDEVCVRGRGVFESVATGRRWREEFVYVLGDWEGGQLGRWEVWADPLSAWVAVDGGEVEGWGRGELQEKQKD